VHHLQQVFAHDNVAVLYVYCDYKDQVNQTDRNLFANFAKQSILQQLDLPAEAKALYDSCEKGGRSPSSNQCLDLLMSSMASFHRTFIVIDAVDEHLPSEKDEYNPDIPLLRELSSIQQKMSGRCTIFITSREILLIQEQLQDRIRLDVRAHDEDIKSYVNSRICDDKKFTFAKEIRTDSALADEIVEKMVAKAQGM
jgi:hypothetical protein